MCNTLDGNLDWHVEKKQWLQITYFSKLAHSSEIHLINNLNFFLSHSISNVRSDSWYTTGLHTALNF